MEYTVLKNNIKIFRVGLGCWALGGRSWSNGHASGWADIDEFDVREAIDYAMENGVNHFDNADCYGNGRSEEMLGRILGDRKNDVVIASKVGHLKNEFEHAYIPQNIRQQCEKSLKNLGRDYIDIYYFHHGNFGKDDCYLDDAIDIMHRLQSEGKIRAIGLSAYTTADFVRLVPKIRPDVLQSWAHIMDDKFIREKTLVRQLLEKYKISFIAFSPLNQGLLLGKYSAKNPPKFGDGDHRKDLKKFSKKALEILEPKIEKLKECFGNSTKDLSSVALKYLLANPVVGSVIPGFRNKAQVQMNLEAINTSPLTKEQIHYIECAFNIMNKE